MLLGAVPAIIVGVVYGVLLVILAVNLGNLSVWATPFASEWAEPWRTLFRILVGAAIVGLSVVFVVFTFTAITLAVGDPFYERIRRHVEERAGGLPDAGAPARWYAGLLDGLRMLVRAMLGGILIFLVGLVPVVGQVAAILLGALFAGWLLAVELTGRALDARGYDLRQRRRVLAGDRAGALGFGIATYLLFLLPLGAVIVMPAAVAGGTLLARQLVRAA